MTPHGTRLVLAQTSDAAQAHLLSAAAARCGWRAIIAANGEQVLAQLGTRDGMMLDTILLTRDDPAPLIAEIIARRPALPIVWAGDSIDVAMQAMRAGAADFVRAPLHADRLMAALDAALRHRSAGECRPLTERLDAPLGFDAMVGTDAGFRQALALATRSVRARVPVLIEGESGTGKAMLARAIHAASPRAGRAFIEVDAGQTPAALLDSALFGHEQGAFAGAFARQVGCAVLADGGTLFIRSVDKLPQPTQLKLLDLIKSGEIMPLGKATRLRCDVRLMVSSSVPLAERVATGAFREDVYDQLRLVHIRVPALRVRGDDIVPLAIHLLRRAAALPHMREVGLNDAARQLLRSYGWPGNVRQLQGVLFRAALAAPEDLLQPVHFPALMAQSPILTGPRAPQVSGVALYLPDGHIRTLEQIEADVIRLAIGHYRGRMSEVARRLGIGRSTLYRKLVELGLSDVA